MSMQTPHGFAPMIRPAWIADQGDGWRIVMAGGAVDVAAPDRDTALVMAGEAAADEYMRRRLARAPLPDWDAPPAGDAWEPIEVELLRDRPVTPDLFPPIPPDERRPATATLPWQPWRQHDAHPGPSGDGS